jgi:hypothetical protein
VVSRHRRGLDGPQRSYIAGSARNGERTRSARGAREAGTPLESWPSLVPWPRSVEARCHPPAPAPLLCVPMALDIPLDRRGTSPQTVCGRSLCSGVYQRSGSRRWPLRVAVSDRSPFGPTADGRRCHVGSSSASDDSSSAGDPATGHDSPRSGAQRVGAVFDSRRLCARWTR